jgi:hypothetical protein
MAGFPHPAPNRHSYVHGDGHRITTPALAHDRATHGNLNSYAFGNPIAICHAVIDTVPHPPCLDRPIGNDPPACHFRRIVGDR